MKGARLGRVDAPNFGGLYYLKNGQKQNNFLAAEGRFTRLEGGRMNGTAEEAAEKVGLACRSGPQRLKPGLKTNQLSERRTAAPPKIKCNLEFFRSR